MTSIITKKLLYKLLNTIFISMQSSILPGLLFTALNMILINDPLYSTNVQGSKGIRQWPLNLCASPMMIIKLVVETFGQST